MTTRGRSIPHTMISLTAAVMFLTLLQVGCQRRAPEPYVSIYEVRLGLIKSVGFVRD